MPLSSARSRTLRRTGVSASSCAGGAPGGLTAPAGGGLFFGLEGQALALGGRDMVQTCQLLRSMRIQLGMLRITLGCGFCDYYVANG